MQCQRKLKKAAVLIVLILFGLVFIYRYQYINTKFPNPVVKEHYIDVPFTYQGVEMTLTEFQIIGHDEFLEEYDLDPQGMNMEIRGATQKNVIVTLTVNNKGDTKKEINAGELMLLETAGWASYTDYMDSFRLLNKGESMLIEVNPGEEKALRFSYCLYDLSFQENDFVDLDTSKFSIVLSLYPQKNVVRLN